MENMETHTKIFGGDMQGEIGGLNKHARIVLREISRSIDMRVN
jgi:hypothetical protein